MEESSLTISLVRYIMPALKYFFNYITSQYKLDYYLVSSETFNESLGLIDTGRILDGLESKEDGLNERILKLICIN